MKEGIIMNQEKIGKFIAKCRKDKNLTQQELANKIGVTDRAVSNWENGRRLPDISIMMDLCNVLSISVNELLEGNKLTSKDINNISEKNALALLFTKNHLENFQIAIEVLIFIGIFFTITISSFLTEDIHKLVTYIGGLFVWGFGLFLRSKIKKIKKDIYDTWI
jgi:transcriptional regulator with XRE-family HTH domain